MRKKLCLIFLAIQSLAFSQIGIANTAPDATLDVKALKADGSTSEGIMIPRLTGDQIKNAGNQYAAAQTGAMVYVTSVPSSTDTKTADITAPGCYYFNGSVWKSMGKSVNTTVISYSTTVDPNILGYIPSKTATAASAPQTVSAGGHTYTKVASISYSSNGHSYTAYSGSTAISWFDAYNAAKNMGGYLATFASDAEWQYVEQNLLNNSVFNTQKAWIGFVKFSWYAGAALTPDPEEKWISGEQPVHDYSAGGTNAVKKSGWFANGEPNNAGSGEGFVHTYEKNAAGTKTYNGYTSYHLWNDFPANNGYVNAFIIEFQQ
ncbi:hypothetical protein [Chryseobacterium hagamense]|uniref:C-type lectin domain-containing protein n=1 Tax=Chryseobacterium hagamense TaxID=395935 RepID=A0A511YKA9_9FLAO|nr:hypothetical protein [Chryseobacterium hagamense]GEN75637.1 hypothetical protein CHA01nite_13770 [Chryseobacterium hagamense]